MFTQLMPLIQSRPLTITVAALDGNRIRVNVVPQAIEKDKKANAQIGYAHNKEVAAIPDTAIAGLTTPLSLTGTPEEIDSELAKTLTRFTALHVGLQQNYDAAAEAIAASIRAIDERERIKKEKDKAKGKLQNLPKAEEPKSSDTLPLAWTTASRNPSSASIQAELGLSGQSAEAPAASGLADSHGEAATTKKEEEQPQ